MLDSHRGSSTAGTEEVPQPDIRVGVTEICGVTQIVINRRVVGHQANAASADELLRLFEKPHQPRLHDAPPSRLHPGATVAASVTAANKIERRPLGGCSG